VHVFSTRWSRTVDGRECPLPWREAENLRRLSTQGDARPLAKCFADFGHLARQYARVVDRMPAVIGEHRAVVVAHDIEGRAHDVHGHFFLVRLPSGHPLACLSLNVDVELSELPAALISALELGPELQLRVADEQPTTLHQTVNETASRIAGLRSALQSGDGAGGDPRLLLSSEVHTMVFVRDGDDRLGHDEELVRRLLGRVREQESSVRDPAIVYPGEFNRGARTFGALRPGASVLAGHPEPVNRNALVSVLLLMGAASLLREARDEAYAVLDCVSENVQSPHHRWSLLAADPLEDEHARLAAVEIAVAFHVETHLDMRRVISDAYLVGFHQCLASSLAIPQSVEAIHSITGQLDAAIRAVASRSTTRNAYAITLLAAIVIGFLTVVVSIVK
jgi:hypothetical protein